MRVQLDVVLWRGGIVESRHRMQLAVSDPEGALALETDSAAMETTFRSAAKPFQLLPLVERGHADRWGWSDEQLAVMTASHIGSASHVALVAGILQKMGLEERHLACGYHDPLDPQSLAHLRAHPEARGPLYNNCSGKHAGMLCLALSEGWPVEHYERPEHPVQQLMRRTIAEMCGLPPDRLAVAVDGCSVMVFGAPLARMARAFARLASASATDADPRERALARIRGAMQAHPRAVGGVGRLSTALMEAAPGRLVAKGGAEGLECVGLPTARLGLALKCEDGHMRAVAPALVAVIERLGWMPGAAPEALAEWRHPVLRNHAGLEVGSLEAVIGEPSPALR
jgi:L-asparaginase II